jgi:hypothetical protein
MKEPTLFMQQLSNDSTDAVYAIRSTDKKEQVKET